MKSIAQEAAEELVRSELIDILQPDTPDGVEEAAKTIAEIIDRHIVAATGFDNRRCAIARHVLARHARDGGESDQAIVSYVQHLEARVASYAPTNMAEVWRENERLKAVVDRLPKTADGVPVVYDDEVYCFDGEMQDIRLGWVKSDTHASMRDHVNGGYNEWPISECYSTREAASAASQLAKKAS